MDKSLAQRLKAYIETHPFDSGDSDYETVLDQLYHAYAESHESDPPEISDGFKELESYLETPCPTITPSSTSPADYAVRMSARLLSTECSMVRTW